MNIFSPVFSNTLLYITGVTGDWFLAILLLTFAIKIILFPLSVKQQRSIFISQNIAEAREILENKFKNKKERVNEVLLEVVKKYKVNPLGPFLVILAQTPIFFSLYFSISHLITPVGSIVIPWVLSVNSQDVLHISPVIAAFFQGLSVLTGGEKNVLASVFFVVLAAVFLWKAPVGLSVYWISNAALGMLEKRIFNTKFFRQRYLNVSSAEEMLKSIV